MAYLTFVAAVPHQQIDAIRADETTVLTPTMVNGVSHLLSYWIEIQPLGELLARTIDGGEPLNESFWHPLRPPMMHEPDDVASLAKDLTITWQSVRAANASDDEWLDSEMNRLLAVMSHACDNMDAIVTALDLPGDDERAQRVRIPWLPYSEMHGAKRRRWWSPWR
jgi:hypothetical protein